MQYEKPVKTRTDMKRKAPCEGGSGISYVATKEFLEYLGVRKGKGTGRLHREHIALQIPCICTCSLWG